MSFRRGSRLTRIDALELWDAHRTPIILAVFALLVAARVYLHANDRRGELVALPKIYGEREPPMAESVEAESPITTDEETDSLLEDETTATGQGATRGSRQGLRKRAG